VPFFEDGLKFSCDDYLDGEVKPIQAPKDALADLRTIVLSVECASGPFHRRNIFQVPIGDDLVPKLFQLFADGIRIGRPEKTHPKGARASLFAHDQSPPLAIKAGIAGFIDVEVPMFIQGSLHKRARIVDAARPIGQWKCRQLSS
jgi:hypothetical protein